MALRCQSFAGEMHQYSASTQIQLRVVMNFIADNHVHNRTILWPLHFLWAKHRWNRVSEIACVQKKNLPQNKMHCMFSLEVFHSPDVLLSLLNYVHELKKKKCRCIGQNWSFIHILVSMDALHCITCRWYHWSKSMEIQFSLVSYTVRVI